MRRVILESPYMAKTEAEIAANVTYARAAVRDCLLRGDSAIASHLNFTQPGILRDNDQSERALGMRAGMAWTEVAEAVVVYTDRGISPGMKSGITRASKLGLPIEYRKVSPLHPDQTVASPAELHDLLLTVGHDVDVARLVHAARSDLDIRHAVAWAQDQHARAQGLPTSGAPAVPPAWLEDLINPLPETKP